MIGRLLLLCLIISFALSGCLGEGSSTSHACVDGTLPGSCSSGNAPEYCTSDGQFINAADLCGCPPGFEASGSACVPQ